jgi:hypothetical protein
MTLFVDATDVGPHDGVESSRISAHHPTPLCRRAVLSLAALMLGSEMSTVKVVVGRGSVQTELAFRAGKRDEVSSPVMTFGQASSSNVRPPDLVPGRWRRSSGRLRSGGEGSTGRLSSACRSRKQVSDRRWRHWMNSPTVPPRTLPRSPAAFHSGFPRC